MRMPCVLAFAAVLAGSAPAEVSAGPKPTIDPACLPLLGVWHRVEPAQERVETMWTIWTILAIDSSSEATAMTYTEYGYAGTAKGTIYYEAGTQKFQIRCTAHGNGMLTAEFLGPPDSQLGWSIDVVLNGDSFTTSDKTAYAGPWPPPPDWKPETYSVTYEKVLP